MLAVAWTHKNKDESRLRRKDRKRERKLAPSELVTGKKEERHLGRIVKGNTSGKGTQEKMSRASSIKICLRLKKEQN